MLATFYFKGYKIFKQHCNIGSTRFPKILGWPVASSSQRKHDILCRNQVKPGKPNYLNLNIKSSYNHMVRIPASRKSIRATLNCFPMQRNLYPTYHIFLHLIPIKNRQYST